MKVTVCFGGTRVVVPCGDGDILIRDLIHESVRRYRKATAKPRESWVCVRNLKSLSDGGILDPDDQLLAVVDDRDQILAIYDEQDPVPGTGCGDGTTSSAGTGSPDWGLRHSATSLAFPNRPQAALDNAVEIRNLDRPPTSGLLVVRPNSPAEERSVEWTRKKRPAPKTPAELAPAPDFQNSPSSPSDYNLLGPKRFGRNGARQSSLAGFLEAGLDLQEKQQVEKSRVASPSTSETSTLVLSGTPGKALGMQVAAMYGDRGKLCGVKVTQIHETGRVFEDGGLRLNDVISEICGRPVYQMSFVRAQSYLHEASQDHVSPVSFTFSRTKSWEESGEDGKKKWGPESGSGALAGSQGPQSALQKANTRRIGHKSVVELRKGARGLGFTVTSRDTASENDRPFYIKTVLPEGAAIEDGRLLAGDRLLNIDGKEVTGMTQKEVVELLRSVEEGRTVELAISRHPGVAVRSQSPLTPAAPLSPRLRRKNLSGGSSPSPLPRVLSTAPPEASTDSPRRLALDIPLNDTGSAGLGVSVKGRTAAVPDGKPQDCGIFVKKIIHGGAAHKDGQLRENDQLVGINGNSLLGLSNEDAMSRISETMQHLSPSATSIQLDVERRADSPPPPLPRHPPPPPSLASPAGTQSLDLNWAEDSKEEDLYALIVKKSPTLPCPEADPTVLIEEEDGNIYQPPSAHPVLIYDEVDSIVNVVDAGDGEENPFDRESNLRQSISEKRHLAAKNNPSHTLLYQKIKHQRQTSAPVLQSEEPVADPPPQATLYSQLHTPGQRRSLSLESLSRAPSTPNGVASTAQPMIHELAMQSCRDSGRKNLQEQKRWSAMKKAQRNRTTNESFRNAVDRSYQIPQGAEAAVDVGGSLAGQPHPMNHHSHSLPREAKNKDRRKSTGSGLFSKPWFRFGSQSRDGSPDKKLADPEAEAQERARRAAQEEQNRIREQYEKLKRQQQDVQQRQTASPTPKMASYWRPPVPRTSSDFANGDFRPVHHQHRLPPPFYFNPRRDAEEPPWFALASEHSKFYRSLDRPIAPPRTVALGPVAGRQSLTLKHSTNDDAPRDESGSWSRGAAPTPSRPLPPSSASLYETCTFPSSESAPLPPSSRPPYLNPIRLAEARRTRPASNYFDYRSVVGTKGGRTEEQLRQTFFLQESEEGTRTLLSNGMEFVSHM